MEQEFVRYKLAIDREIYKTLHSTVLTDYEKAVDIGRTAAVYSRKVFKWCKEGKIQVQNYGTTEEQFEEIKERERLLKEAPPKTAEEIGELRKKVEFFEKAANYKFKFYGRADEEIVDLCTWEYILEYESTKSIVRGVTTAQELNLDPALIAFAAKDFELV